MNREEEIQALKMSYMNTFESEHGRKVMEDLSKFCLEKRDIFVEDSARKTDYNLGANSVIRYIRSKLMRTETKPEVVINKE